MIPTVLLAVQVWLVRKISTNGGVTIGSAGGKVELSNPAMVASPQVTEKRRETFRRASRVSQRIKAKASGNQDKSALDRQPTAEGWDSQTDPSTGKKYYFKEGDSAGQST